MNTWGRVLIVGLLTVTSLIAGVVPAMAGSPSEILCSGALTNRIVQGTLVVPAEQDCDLQAEDTEITGDVHIGEQASADFYHVRVGGNIDIRGA